jgi:hypothetical protein
LQRFQVMVMLTSGRLLRCRRHILGIDGVETWTTLARQSAKELILWLWTADPRHATVLSPSQRIPKTSRIRIPSRTTRCLHYRTYHGADTNNLNQVVVRWLNITIDLSGCFCCRHRLCYVWFCCCYCWRGRATKSDEK